MALANAPVVVQGSRVDLGLGLVESSWLIVPGTSDYVTGGYAITATMLGYSLLQQAWVSEANATATGYEAFCVFALAQLAGSSMGETGYSQFLFKVDVVTTGSQVGSGGNLAGCKWAVTVRGF